MVAKEIKIEMVKCFVEPLFGIDGKARRRMRRKKLKIITNKFGGFK